VNYQGVYYPEKSFAPLPLSLEKHISSPEELEKKNVFMGK